MSGAMTDAFTEPDGVKIDVLAYLLLERFLVVWTLDITYPGCAMRRTEFLEFQDLESRLLTTQSTYPGFSVVAQQALARAKDAGLPTLTVPQPADYESAILDVFNDHPPGVYLSEGQLDYEAEELKLWKRFSFPSTCTPFIRYGELPFTVVWAIRDQLVRDGKLRRIEIEGDEEQPYYALAEPKEGN
jgi:hypothetical protein